MNIKDIHGVDSVHTFGVCNSSAKQLRARFYFRLRVEVFTIKLGLSKSFFKSHARILSTYLIIILYLDFKIKIKNHTRLIEIKMLCLNQQDPCWPKKKKKPTGSVALDK